MLALKGSTSGTGTLNAPAVASTYVWTLPAATGTLADIASTQTFTNKTWNCANQTSCVVRLNADVTGTLQATNFPALTGDVTTSAGSLATTIAANAVTYAKMSTAAIATGAEYFAGTASKLVPASQIYQAQVTVTYGATTTFDFSTFIDAQVTLTGNITTMTLTNVMVGKSGSIAFTQDATGGRTVALNTIFKFPGGIVPTLTTTPGAIDILYYTCRTTLYCPASLTKDVK